MTRFARFLDLFNNRFIQLFFRAWADSRPIAQHDRPDADRFIAYIGSAIGIGSSPYGNLDSVPDAAKLGFAGIMGAQAKSAHGWPSVICGLFGSTRKSRNSSGRVSKSSPSEWTRLGHCHNALGSDALLGGRIFSVQDKIRVRDYT